MIIFKEMKTTCYFILRWNVPSNADFHHFAVTYSGNRKIAHLRASKYLGRVDRKNYKVIQISTIESVFDKKKFVSISPQQWASLFR